MIEALIKKIAQQLDKEQIPYMIIGGQAVLLYGSPRLTRDIDITLGIDTDKFELIEKVCKKLGLKLFPKNSSAFVQATKVLPVEEPKLKIRVDFIFSFTLYETQAIARAGKVLMNDYPIKFATPEDIIIHKMIAGRAVDLEDVRNILIKRKKSVDLKYIKKWLSQFSDIPEHEGILKIFNVILKKYN